MAIRVNPKLINILEKYGAEDDQKCYHCGNCSAVCPHADETFVFPRRPMRLLQMGLQKRLENSLDPWLCYYCGQCSAQCPRGAEPGETMMSLRRWLTSCYDFTGISRLFYRSWKAEIAAILLVGILTATGFLLYGFAHGDIHAYDGPTAFFNSSVVHVFDWIMAIVLATFLAINAARMWWFTTGRDQRIRIPFRLYLEKLYTLPLHFITQKRYATCGEKRSWLIHMGLVFSYLSLLVLIMFFLKEMQYGPEILWSVHGLGYAAALGLLLAVIWMIYGRLKKSEVHFKHSHESDWIFLIMLLLVTLTGILQHILHRTGAPEAANIMYVVHLALVVPMLTLEVPFSKWAHLAYRPLAMYLAQVHSAALQRARMLAPQAAPMKLAS
jgi:quinone-modifying oxidoreductase, subunit QmoC